MTDTAASDPTNIPEGEPIEVRHRWRERLCRLLNHGTYEVREELGRGNVLVSTLVRRECGRGHLWQRRVDLDVI